MKKPLLCKSCSWQSSSATAHNKSQWWRNTWYSPTEESSKITGHTKSLTVKVKQSKPKKSLLPSTASTKNEIMTGTFNLTENVWWRGHLREKDCWISPVSSKRQSPRSDLWLVWLLSDQKHELCYSLLSKGHTCTEAINSPNCYHELNLRKMR